MSSIRFILFACLYAPGALSAQTIINWANVGTDFGTASNWVGNVAPGASDIAQFASATPAAQPVVGGAVGVGGIAFSSAAGSFTLSGAGPLTVGGSGVDNQSSSAQAISVPLIFSGSSSTISNGGNLTISGAVANNTSAGLTLSGLGNGTISGVISGAGNLIKSGGGTWTLSGANTFTGNVTVAGGTLSVSADSNFGAVPSVPTPGAITLSSDLSVTSSFTLNANRGIQVNNGLIQVTDGATLTYGGTIAGINGLEVAGGGTLLLTGNSTYTGRTNVFSGTLRLGPGAAIVPGQALWLSPLSNSPAAFDLGDNSLTIGLLRILGVGSAATISIGPSGVLTLGDQVLLNAGQYSGPAVVSGGSVALSTATTFTVSDVANTTTELTISSPISGGFGITKTGAGTLVLSGTNTYSGGTTVSGGTISISSDANLGSGSLTLDGGILATTATVALDAGRSFTLGAGGGTLNLSGNSFSYAGAITGPGGLVKTGTGYLTLTGTNTYSGGTTITGGVLDVGGGGTTGSIAGDVAGTAELRFRRADALTFPGVVSGTLHLSHMGSGTLTLSGANSYTGNTTVNFGTLAIGADINLGTAPASAQQTSVYLALGATLRSMASFALSATRGVFVDTGANFEMDPGTTLTYNGIIAGHGGWAKSGAGTLVLGGASTFTGGVTINAGTVQLGAHNTLPASGALTLAGGTLAMNGFNQTLGVLTLNNSSTLDFSGGASALSFANSSGAAWTGTLSILNYTDGSDTLRFGTTSGGLTASQLAKIDFGGGLTAQIDSFGNLTPIPEPSTYAMIAGSAMLGMAVWRQRALRRRRRNQGRTD